MNHDELVASVDDYVDDVLDPDARGRLETHLVRCATCRQRLMETQSIRQAARSLNAPEPPERVWTSVAAALRQRRPSTPADRRRGQVLGRLSKRTALAVAASLLLAIAAVVGLRHGIRAPESTRTQAELADWVSEELRLAEGHYENAILGLERILEDEPSSLDPEVMAVLRNNLTLIDEAIEESRQALRQQPASSVAQESLLQGLRRKLVLLQNTILLINEVRRGRGDNAQDLVERIQQGRS